MSSKREVESFLRELQAKMKVFEILFLDDRGKNQQALHDLEISPSKRKEIISKLTYTDYSEGPIEEKMLKIPPMWVFGKIIKNKEVYIKISIGSQNLSIICISFHIAEYKMKYPLKNKQQ